MDSEEEPAGLPGPTSFALTPHLELVGEAGGDILATGWNGPTPQAV